MQISFNNKTLNLDTPKIMGILNVTPDSFSDGGRWNTLDRALAHAEQMVKEGATIIDIGGESTRPGATPVPLDEELLRVIPVVEKLSKELDVMISIDTSQPKVMEEAVKAGAHIWNDISLYNMMHAGTKSVEVEYERDGKDYTVVLEPKQNAGDAFPLLGITGGEMVRPGLFGTVRYGAYTVKYWITYTVDSLKMLVGGKVGVKDLSGPVGIVSAVDNVYQEAAPAGMVVVILNLLNIGVLLTANLGVMNLLPLPALDGGRLVFLIIEAVRGKRVPPEKEGMVHFAGFVLLMALMVVIMFNDILKLV